MVSTASNAVKVMSVITSWDFCINMLGNIVAGLLSGWVVTRYYRKCDAIKAYREKQYEVAGCAMNITCRVDDALFENSANGYERIHEKISEISKGISNISLEYLKTDESNEYIKRMRGNVAEIEMALLTLSHKMHEKEVRSPYYMQHKKWMDEEITINKEKLENNSRELFHTADEFHTYIISNS